MGQSSLFNGERRHKDDPIFDALGSVDELNAAVGMAYVQCEAEYAGTTVDPSTTPSLGDKGLGWLLPQLKEIQMRLLDVGSLVATPLRTSPSERLNRVSFDGVSEANKLERYIDAMDAQLPPLTVFILPGGGAPSASLHFARAVCRRAERKVCTLVRHEDCDTSAAIYLNRLSDYCFVAARFAAGCMDQPETRRERKRRN